MVYCTAEPFFIAIIESMILLDIVVNLFQHRFIGILPTCIESLKLIVGRTLLSKSIHFEIQIVKEESLQLIFGQHLLCFKPVILI